jgi:serine/threonine protein kinase
MSASLEERYELGQVAGSGSYGNVLKAKHRLTQTDVAVKMVSKEMLSDPSVLAHFENEVKLLKGINHPRVIRFHELIEGPDAWYLVTEFAEKGDILEYMIKMGSTFGEQETRDIFWELVQAVAYLHETVHIVHGDLKLENVLLDTKNHIRVIDFGFSQQFSRDSQVFTLRCGSPAYMAPEIVMGAPYGKSVDIWSLGVILYALVLGSLPFEGATIEEQLRNVVFGRPRYPSDVRGALRSLLSGMLEKDPRKRITLQEIREHPWMGRGWEELQFPEQQINESIVAHIGALGLTFSADDLRDGIDNEATVAYKILERDRMVREVGSEQAMRSPILHASPMKQSRRPPIEPVRSPTRPRGTENENNGNTIKVAGQWKRRGVFSPAALSPPSKKTKCPLEFINK